MQNFLAVYLGSGDAGSPAAARWSAMDDVEREKERRRGVEAWHRWMETHRASIVDAGGPLGRTKRISADGVSEAGNRLTGYVVVRAGSHEAAAKMFENHPHFAILPGHAVEIMPCLPIPGA
ncbi:MAG: hypothetical protein R3263_09820 [Myxococcota bacterium]|nr:hypothetical protein [Myxococcota bacterium]